MNIISNADFQALDILFADLPALHSVYIAATNPLAIPHYDPPRFSHIQQLSIAVPSLDDFIPLLRLCPALTSLHVTLESCVTKTSLPLVDLPKKGKLIFIFYF